MKIRGSDDMHQEKAGITLLTKRSRNHIVLSALVPDLVASPIFPDSIIREQQKQDRRLRSQKLPGESIGTLVSKHEISSQEFIAAVDLALRQWAKIFYSFGIILGDRHLYNIMLNDKDHTKIYFVDLEDVYDAVQNATSLSTRSRYSRPTSFADWGNAIHEAHCELSGFLSDLEQKLRFLNNQVIPAKAQFLLDDAFIFSDRMRRKALDAAYFDPILYVKQYETYLHKLMRGLHQLF